VVEGSATAIWHSAWPVTNHANAKLGTYGADLMGVVTVVRKHGETIAHSSGGNQQVNRVNPRSLAAVDQVGLDLSGRGTSPVVHSTRT
jgi:hypothetical protein